MSKRRIIVLLAVLAPLILLITLANTVLADNATGWSSANTANDEPSTEPFCTSASVDVDTGEEIEEEECSYVGIVQTVGEDDPSTESICITASVDVDTGEVTEEDQDCDFVPVEEGPADDLPATENSAS